MANRNDFIIINAKSIKMFNYVHPKFKTQISEEDKARIGFYYLVLEGINGVIEPDDPRCCIIDTNYNSIIHGRGVDDLGMDAVFIAEDQDTDNNAIVNIKLFNFKYRNKFIADKTKTEKDLSTSTKFLEYITTSRKQSDYPDNLVSQQINKIIDFLDKPCICNIELYMVTNEEKGFEKSSNTYIDILENSFGMKIINISLDEIMSFFNEKKDTHNSKFLINSSDFLQFEIDEKSTQKSYIIKLSLLDLIRITSTDPKLTNKYSEEDDSLIAKAKLDFSLLYDNVRGFLGETKYNKNIISTLEKDHKKFFMFNNGITITAENIDSQDINSYKKYLFDIQNFQIVNGGQTLRAIYSFFEKRDIDYIAKLREANVMIRIFKVVKDDELKNKIAEYTNSQNVISDSDLKSIDPLQIQLEKYLRDFKILYSRKSGDLGQSSIIYDIRISMEKMAQLLYSIKGYPDRASNQKSRLFQDYYNEIFNGTDFSLEKCKDLILQSDEITAEYKNTHYKYYEQKLFYIIYIVYSSNLTISDAIKKLEALLTEFPNEKEISEARILILKKFKDYVISKLQIPIS